MGSEPSQAGKSPIPDSECKKEGLKDRLMARTREERARRRRRLLRVALIAAVAITAFLLSYPRLEVVWYIARARSGDPEARKYALQWLAERKVEKAVPVFVKALEGTRGESEYAMEVLRTLAGKEIVPELINIWQSKEAPEYARNNALQLIAEKGDKSHAQIFVNTEVLLGKGWDSVGSAWDFLRKHADASTVDMILKMFSSDDAAKRQAAAAALRPIKEMDMVKKNDAALDALAGAVKDSDWVVRREALRTLSGIARPKDMETVISALLEDEKPIVRSYAADVLGELGDKRATASLVRSLKDPGGKVCVASANALVKIGDFGCTDALAAIIRDEKGETFVRIQAIGVLRRIRAPRSEQIFASVLGSVDSGVAVEAAKSLARVGTQESIGALAEAAKSTNPELRLWSAYALGLVGEPASQETLLTLLEDGEPAVVRTAVRALLIVGSPACADKAAQVSDKLGPQSVNSREIAYLLTSYRTPESISTLIDFVLSAYPQLREEGRVRLNEIGRDLRSYIAKEKSYAEEIILSGAEKMVDGESGSKLSSIIKGLPAARRANGQIDIFSLTSAVLKTIRDLPEVYELDRDRLENALVEARTFYWTVTLVEVLKAAGLDQKKIVSLAQELVRLTSDAEAFEKVPAGEIASGLRAIAQELNLPGAQEGENRK